MNAHIQQNTAALETTGTINSAVTVRSESWKQFKRASANRLTANRSPSQHNHSVTLSRRSFASELMPNCTFVLTFLKQERHFSGMCLCLYDKGSMCARVCACNYDVDMMLLSLLKDKIRESKHLHNLDSKIMSLFFGLSVVRVGVWRDRCSISMQLEQRSITDLFTCKVLNCCSVSLSCGYYHPASVSWSVCATGPPTAERIPCSSGRTNHRPAGALKSHKWPPRLGSFSWTHYCQSVWRWAEKLESDRRARKQRRGCGSGRRCSHRTVSQPPPRQHRYMHAIFGKDACLLFQDFGHCRCIFFPSDI